MLYAKCGWPAAPIWTKIHTARKLVSYTPRDQGIREPWGDGGTKVVPCKVLATEIESATRHVLGKQGALPIVSPLEDPHIGLQAQM